jgi:hypothetical protein
VPPWVDRVKPRFTRSTDEQLVERFRGAAHKVGEAVTIWMPAVALTNRLFEIKDALRARGKEARLKLAPLLGSYDRFVRYYAAQELYGLLPELCRPIIEENSRSYDALRGDAGMFLRAIDTGFYKPD